LGRWIAGEECWPGVMLRGGLLATISVVAIHSYGTLWYWLMLPTAMLPLVDTFFGRGLTASWFAGRRLAQVGEAMSAAAHQPANPAVRLRLGRALLEAGHVD